MIGNDAIERAIYEVLAEAGCPVLHEHLHRRVEAKFGGARWPVLQIDLVLMAMCNRRIISARGVEKQVGWNGEDRRIIENIYELGVLDRLATL